MRSLTAPLERDHVSVPTGAVSPEGCALSELTALVFPRSTWHSKVAAERIQ